MSPRCADQDRDLKGKRAQSRAKKEGYVELRVNVYLMSVWSSPETIGEDGEGGYGRREGKTYGSSSACNREEAQVLQ